MPKKVNGVFQRTCGHFGLIAISLRWLSPRPLLLFTSNFGQSRKPPRADVNPFIVPNQQTANSRYPPAKCSSIRKLRQHDHHRQPQPQISINSWRSSGIPRVSIPIEVRGVCAWDWEVGHQRYNATSFDGDDKYLRNLAGKNVKKIFVVDAQIHCW